MDKKIHNLKSLEFMGDAQFLVEELQRLDKESPNIDLSKAVKALNNIIFYAVSLESDIYFSDKSVSSYREQKNQAIQEASRLRTELKKYKECQVL